MKRLMRICVIGVLVIIWSTAASGAVFTDRAAFQAAISTFTIEDFENAALSGTTGSGAVASIAFTDFTVSSVPNAVKVLDVPAFGADNTTPGGERYLYLDTDFGSQGSVASFFNFSTPLLAFGFDYSQLNEPGAAPQIAIGSDTFNVSLNPPPLTNFNPLFWGFVGASSFSGVQINSDFDSGYGIDDVTFSVIPEPSTLALAALALLGLLTCRRRRRA